MLLQVAVENEGHPAKGQGEFSLAMKSGAFKRPPGS